MARKPLPKRTKNPVVCTECWSIGSLSIYKKTQYRIYHGVIKGKPDYCYLGNFSKVLENLQTINKLKKNVLSADAPKVVAAFLTEFEKNGTSQLALTAYTSLANLTQTLKRELQSKKDLQRKYDLLKIKHSKLSKT